MFQPKVRLNNVRMRPTVSLSSRPAAKTANKPGMPARATSRDTLLYRPIKVLGKGAFGIVYCARAPNGTVVAIKKVHLDPHYKNRELDILKLLSHRNCIMLKDEYKSSGRAPNVTELNIVMDYLPMSLHQFSMNYRRNKKYPPVFFVKLFGYQLFTGLDYLHKAGITHRDIKPENVLIDPDTGELKICDFGSAKMLKPGDKSVSYIASRFYRAPELIYGCEKYTNAVDIWAAGCVVAEILTAGNPIFAAQESDNQITEIIAILGPPKKRDMASFEHPPVNVKGVQKTTLERVLPGNTPPDVLDLLKTILVYNPTTRPTAEDCMKHPCFADLFSGKLKLPNGKKLPQLQKPT